MKVLGFVSHAAPESEQDSYLLIAPWRHNSS